MFGCELIFRMISRFGSVPLELKICFNLQPPLMSKCSRSQRPPNVEFYGVLVFVYALVESQSSLSSITKKEGTCRSSGPATATTFVPTSYLARLPNDVESGTHFENPPLGNFSPTTHNLTPSVLTAMII